ncbi:ABC transporter ATP-binding protein/permease [Flavobacteriaceae bacterium]|nr:ABC transporter ATP-binding protein/permease [Flavobacteriaceae bacterium]
MINIFILLRLLKSVISILSRNEKIRLMVFGALSIFNTFLELLSIAFIINLLFIIGGETTDETFFSSFYDILMIGESPILISSILMISTILIKSTFQVYFNYNQEKISHDIQKRLSIKLFMNFLYSKYEDYTKQNSSLLLRVLTRDSVAISNSLINPFISIINEILLIVFVTFFIFYYNFILGMSVYLISLILIIAFSLYFNNKVKRLGEIFVVSDTSRIKNINESFKSFDFIKLHFKENIFIDLYSDYTDRLTKSGFKNIFFLKLPKIIYEFFIFLFLFILIIILFYINKTDMLISFLSVLAVSIYKIIPSLNKISNSFQAIQFFSAPFYDIIKFLDIDTDKVSPINNLKFNSIDYNNVTFGYGEKVIFSNINLKIENGDFIGINGPSGSGKSTLIKILCGLLVPNNISLMLDRKPFETKNLKNLFSYAPQDPAILDENIYKNIAFQFDENKIDKNKIDGILKKVDLKLGFDNLTKEKLGENGIKISGGQKQRVLIARAIYHEKKILILDESTSNLDPKTEIKILELLKSLNKEITIIFISHKSNSLKYCNKIYEISEGKILNKK